MEKYEASQSRPPPSARGGSCSSTVHPSSSLVHFHVTTKFLSLSSSTRSELEQHRLLPFLQLIQSGKATFLLLGEPLLLWVVLLGVLLSPQQLIQSGCGVLNIGDLLKFLASLLVG